ncbi:MAG: HAD-IA family hydrolase [Patescibacteria group bacterium]
MNEVGLGSALQQARKNKGLTQQQLCGVTGLSYSTLAKIERGAIKSPSIFTVSQITSALGVSIDEVVGSIDSPPMYQKKTAKNGVKFVYFDINGCLLQFFYRAFSQIAQDSGASPEQVEEIYWRYNSEVCAGNLKLEEFNQRMSEKINLPDFKWEQYYLKAISPITETAEVVKWASQHYRVGLLTNIMPGIVDDLIASGLGPDIKYDQIVDSSKVGLVKPDPVIFDLAAKNAGVRPEEILFIDDERANLTEATKHVWHTLWFDAYEPEKSAQKIRDALV